jgi:hypothetical protein
LSQRKRARERNKPLVIKHIENSTRKQDSQWATELILEPENNIKLKLPHPIEGGAGQAAASERQKKYSTTW